MEDVIKMVREEPLNFVGFLALTQATAWITLKIMIGIETFISDYLWKSVNAPAIHDDTIIQNGHPKGQDSQDYVICIMSSEDTEKGVTKCKKKEGNGIRHRGASHRRHDSSFENKCCQHLKDDYHDDSEDVSDNEMSIDNEKLKKHRTRSKTRDTRQSSSRDN
nr:MAG: hypothetical protein [Penaeus semisulcatus pemonivirus]